MATFTPSGLEKPDYSDNAYIFPINRNSDLIDLHGLGALELAGDVFPANPWEGMKVYKADFHELYVWSTLGGSVPAGQWWLLGAGRKINYTPVLNNVTLGAGGVIEGQYFRVGHNGLPNAVAIYYRVHLALGTGGALTGSLEFGLPGVPELWTAAQGTAFLKQVGHALCALNAAPGSAAIPGIVICSGATAVGVGGETQEMARVTPDSQLAGSLWNATVPHVWANASNMWVQGWYWPDSNGQGWGI